MSSYLKYLSEEEQTELRALGVKTPEAQPKQPEASAQTQPTQQQPTQPEGQSISATVTGDPETVGWLEEAGRAVVGATRDAAQNTMHGLIDLSADALGAVGVNVEEGRANLKKRFTLTEAEKQTTTAGQIGREIGRFALGFVGAGGMKAVQGAKAGIAAIPGAGRVANAMRFSGGAMVQGFVGDFAVSDPHEARLADFVQSFPMLENSIAESLASDPDDGATWGRLKAATEGLILGPAADVLVVGVKWTAKLAKARLAGKPTEKLAEQAAEEIDAVSQAAASAPVNELDGLPASVRNGLAPDHTAAPGSATAPSTGAGKPGHAEITKADVLREKVLTPAMVREELGMEAAEAVQKGLAKEATLDGAVTLTDEGIAAALKQPEATRTLYRAERADGTGPYQQDIYGDADGQAPGMFFSGSEEQARAFLKDAPGGRIVKLDVPAADATKFKTKNVLDEYFVPADIAAGRSVMEPPRVRLSPDTREIIREGLRRHVTHGVDLDLPLDSSVFNLTKMDSSQAVKATLDDFAIVMRDEFAHVGGKYRSHETTKALADMIGGRPEVLIDQVRKIAKSADMVDAYLVAGKTMAQSMARDIAELATRIDQGVVGKVGEAELVRRMDILADLVENLSAAQSGFARATSAGRIRTNADILPEKIVELLDDSTRANVKAAVKKIRMAQGNPKGVVAAVKTMGQNQFMAVHNFVWINGILSGLKTTAVNLTGNAVMTAIKPAFRILGGLGMQAVGAGGGKQEVLEGVYTYRALWNTVFDSFEVSKRAWLTEKQVLDTASSPLETTHRPLSSQAFDLDNKSVIGHGVDYLGAIIGAPGRFLNTQDEFFKQINYRAHVSAKAYREALEMKKLQPVDVEDYVQTALDRAFAIDGHALDEQALRYAQEATFTQPLKGEAWGWASAPGDRSIGEWMAHGSNIPLLKGTVLPFIKVPTNLIRTFVDMGPQASLRKQFWSDLNAGGERAATAMGKMGVGTMAWVGAGMLANSERITGAGPQDKDLQRQRRGDGWLPYAFVLDNSESAGRIDKTILDSLRAVGAEVSESKDGNKVYISYARMEPFSWFLGLAADYSEVAAQMEDKDTETFAENAVLALANNMADKTYLRGMIDLMGMLGGGYNKDEAVARYMRFKLASYVPAWMGALNEDTEMKDLRGWFDGVRARIPGVSTSVEARRDNFGDKVHVPMGYPWSAINPYVFNQGKGDGVRAELSRLAASNMDAKFPLPERKLHGVIDLTQLRNAQGQTAYDRWLELHSQPIVAGKNLHESLADLLASPAYKEAARRTGEGDGTYTPSVAVDLIRQRMGLYKNVALMKHLVREFPELGQAVREYTVNSARTHGLGPGAISGERNPLIQR